MTAECRHELTLRVILLNQSRAVIPLDKPGGNQRTQTSSYGLSSLFDKLTKRVYRDILEKFQLTVSVWKELYAGCQVKLVFDR